ncbi:MAG TPA: hypothetical protein VHG88_01920 [Burkholderiales bacterium]|nr:hypothetical protein [Burkholderiales bacterium]
MTRRLFAVIALCLAAPGCSSLLPSSREATASPWKSYEEAQLTFDKVIPGQTTETDLKTLRLDPRSNPNIAILNYADVLMRFVPHSSISLTDLDSGVRECLSAKVLCKGFAISQSSVNRNRNGNFVFDVLGFSKSTQITGWKFQGLLLLKEGVVIYKLSGGTPSIAQEEEANNPLGPVQSIGQKLLGF